MNKTERIFKDIKDEFLKDDYYFNCNKNRVYTDILYSKWYQYKDNIDKEYVLVIKDEDGKIRIKKTRKINKNKFIKSDKMMLIEKKVLIQKAFQYLDDIKIFMDDLILQYDTSYAELSFIYKVATPFDVYNFDDLLPCGDLIDKYHDVISDNNRMENAITVRAYKNYISELKNKKKLSDKEIFILDNQKELNIFLQSDSLTSFVNFIKYSWILNKYSIFNSDISAEKKLDLQENGNLEQFIKESLVEINKHVITNRIKPNVIYLREIYEGF